VLEPILVLILDHILFTVDRLGASLFLSFDVGSLLSTWVVAVGAEFSQCLDALLPLSLLFIATGPDTILAGLGDIKLLNRSCPIFLNMLVLTKSVILEDNLYLPERHLLFLLSHSEMRTRSREEFHASDLHCQ